MPSGRKRVRSHGIRGRAFHAFRHKSRRASRLGTIPSSYLFNMRLDHFASVNLFRPISRRIRVRRPRIPVLMYHSIEEGTQERHPYYQTNTSPSIFTQQMQFLKDHCYRTLRLKEAVDYLRSGRTDERNVVLTFDDGFRDFYTHAFPVLGIHGFTATVFMITSGLQGENRLQFNGRECLTRDEARELHGNGIDIGSHTVTHRELQSLCPREIDSEVGRSKATLEKVLGDRVISFSYPFSFPQAERDFVNGFARALERHGYENGVSTVLGTAKPEDNPFFLPRLPVNSWDDLSLFQAKLEGGYDWLWLPQIAYKTLRHITSACSGAASH